MRGTRNKRKQIGKPERRSAQQHKNILYGKSNNPKLMTIKLICDGLGITLGEFFSCDEFDKLEQSIK